MAASGKAPKAMSSRLATMKFMQRGSATPSTPSEPPAKRQRLSNGSANTSPSAPTPQSAAKSTPGSEGGYANDPGDSKWYLSVQVPQSASTKSPLRIVSAGYSTLDVTEAAGNYSSEDEDKGVNQASGRKSYGKFNRKLENQQNPEHTASESDSEAESDGQDVEIPENDPTGVDTLISKGQKDAAARVRAERKLKRHADSAELNQFAEERRRKEVNLNRLSGISSGGGSAPPPNASKTTCFVCGKQGHVKRDCPKSQSRPSKLRKAN